MGGAGRRARASPRPPGACRSGSWQGGDPSGPLSGSRASRSRRDTRRRFRPCRRRCARLGRPQWLHSGDHVRSSLSAISMSDCVRTAVSAEYTDAAARFSAKLYGGGERVIDQAATVGSQITPCTGKRETCSPESRLRGEYIHVRARSPNYAGGSPSHPAVTLRPSDKSAGKVAIRVTPRALSSMSGPGRVVPQSPARRAVVDLQVGNPPAHPRDELQSRHEFSTRGTCGHLGRA